ncbi:uncharacterized protein LOC132267605 [Cornus florida]|uniref:uncharacterized protein LOC132267605 n=1 Tax=Cornus florida TaxID=4283 RepID=UPI00289FC643|nr:uncharacterized protein LOC132267605 [Cornus florida]
MACLDIMYNQNSTNNGLSMSPRISFSNDFVDSSNHSHHRERSSREAPVSSDFEFSVTNYSMMSADELFFKGRLLPYKDCGSNHCQKTTLRDELLVGDDDGDGGTGKASMRPPKDSTRWKELLGLKNTHIGSRKSAKNDGFVEKRPALIQEEAHANMSSQVRMREKNITQIYV